jgi:hypothetical protein
MPGEFELSVTVTTDGSWFSGALLRLAMAPVSRSAILTLGRDRSATPA